MEFLSILVQPIIANNFPQHAGKFGIIHSDDNKPHLRPVLYAVCASASRFCATEDSGYEFSSPCVMGERACMNVRLQKFLIKCIPFATCRDKLRLKYYYGDNIFNGYLLKAVHDFHVLKHRKDEIEEFCIGSSHAQCGYLARRNTFNLGYSACDLYYSTRIARYWIDAGMPKLKRIIVFYDPFAPGHNIEKSRMAFCSLPWQKLYAIPPRGMLREETIFKSGKVKVGDVEKILNDRIKKNPAGALYSNEITSVCDETVDSPSAASLEKCGYTKRLNLKPDTETKWLIDLYEFAKSHNVEVVAVIPPAHSIYRRYIGLSADKLFESLFKAEKQYGFKVLNYWESTDVLDSDFFDVDHLNKAGTSKLTSLIERDG